MGGQTDGWKSKWMDGQAHSYANGAYDIKYICHHRVRLWFVTQSPSNYCSAKCWSLLGADMMESYVKLLNCMSLKMWPKQKVCDFYDIFTCVLFNEFVLQISLNYDPDCLTNNMSAFVQPSMSLALGVKPSLCKLSVISCNFCMGMVITGLLIYDLHSSVLINQLIRSLITIIFVY